MGANISLFLVSAAFLIGFSSDISKGNNAIARDGTRTVVRVVDGDTLVLSPNEKVRLIGVDTPETKHPKKPVQCFGQEAKQFTTRMASGNEIRLQLDETNWRTGHKDRYGRTLAYVYLKDGTLLNAEIIRRGYGHVYTRFPFHRRAEFRDLEKQARAEGLGLWSTCRLRS